MVETTVETVETNLLDHYDHNQKTKSSQNGLIVPKQATETIFVPPDGGTRALLVMLGSFFCNGILFGVINSYGVFYDKLYDDLKAKNVSDPSGKAALVGSLAMGTTFLVSPISGVLTDFIGIRTTTFLGGALASGGMLLSSFCVDNVTALYFTYGVMYGLGGALAYTPSLAVLGHYFKKYLGKVNGVVTGGSSAFSIVLPYVTSALLKSFGMEWTLRIMALIAGLIMLCAFLFKPANKKLNLKKVALSDAFNMDVIRNKKFDLWAIILALSLFGYFVPYVYMLKFVKSKFGDDVDGKLPLLCVAISSGIGRLFFGFIADHPKVNRIVLQQLSLFSVGAMTMLLPLSTGYVSILVLFSLILGLFDGCFITVIGPVAFDICGSSGGTQAIGFVFGLCSIPLTIGPFVAGLIYEHTQTYDLPLYLAGIPPILGALAMFLTRCVDVPEKKSQNPVILPKDLSNLTTTELLDDKEEDSNV